MFGNFSRLIYAFQPAHGSNSHWFELRRQTGQSTTIVAALPAGTVIVHLAIREAVSLLRWLLRRAFFVFHNGLLSHTAEAQSIVADLEKNLVLVLFLTPLGVTTVRDEEAPRIICCACQWGGKN